MRNMGKYQKIATLCSAAKNAVAIGSRRKERVGAPNPRRKEKSEDYFIHKKQPWFAMSKKLGVDILRGPCLNQHRRIWRGLCSTS